MKSEVDILRFATAGSVDDGKSTLIGRLLYDAQGVFIDQLESLKGTSDKKENSGIDFALITDGLKAEREQGITIDVAYRYFSTPRRKFIIADTPGHVQYTRNMFTGASNSDLAIILIDARKGVLQQSKRHLYISWLLGIKQIIVAINKMDLVNYEEKTFDFIKKDFLSISQNLKLPKIDVIPISALNGDNIISKSNNMKWYKNQTLIELLEKAEPMNNKETSGMRFPVQLVNRVDNEKTKDYRGFLGTLVGDEFSIGTEINVLPSNFNAKITKIIKSGLEVDIAKIGDSVSICLDKEIDISRGDMIVKHGDLPQISNKIIANVCWMDSEPMNIKKKYLFKHCNKITKCIVKDLVYKIDMETLEQQKDVSCIEMNDVCQVSLTLLKNIAYDTYSKNQTTGAFILIDSDTNNTVAAGTIS
jgi:sulfate adenylyltransferase subunit 1